ncbi:alkene reductase [Parahaliea mediterranea]|uniref:Alkene reductase n=1 Tax=Parahaliea mediterranea TaxID=651086 RepID=A0A939DEP0_9GAMM|nr:alkene reductase [Parahaliea mediterranea]MBN7796511.1 alkene reductase [Parahaliea mediterranea]
MKKLFEPVALGRLQLANRVVMAPMTRSRAGDDDCVTGLHVEYYRQRAGAGLVISEGTHPSRDGKGYCRTPGIYNDAQVAAWRQVVDAVHAAGGAMVLQVMHCGRVAHPDNKAADAETVAPSAIAAGAEMFTEGGMKAMVTPRALATEEIPGVVEEYRRATENAYAAGFDGVELHCTSGYLPAQFLSTGTNRREDRYGGSLDNRLRFVVEVLEAMCSVDGADRVGLRICPGNPFNDLHDDNPEETFAALLDRIDGMGLAYLHVIRMPRGPVDNLALARAHFSGPLIVNDSYSAEEADAVIAAGEAAAVSFGRHFIANPDLVGRLKQGLPLAEMDTSTLYTPGEKGFTDYPLA